MPDPIFDAFDKPDEHDPGLNFIVFGNAPWDWDGAWETEDDYHAAQDAAELWEVA